jgi:hypothetical protein
LKDFLIEVLTKGDATEVVAPAAEAVEVAPAVEAAPTATEE